MDLVLQGIESLHDDVRGDSALNIFPFFFLFFFFSLLFFYSMSGFGDGGEWDVCPFSTNSAGLVFYLLCGDGSNY